MKRRRYVPISVRVQVAQRQVEQRWGTVAHQQESSRNQSQLLAKLLFLIFGEGRFELHHRPALVNRPLNRRKTDTVPPANDPEHLVYLLKDEEHRIETYVRGVGAQRSDVSQRRYLKKVAENRGRNKTTNKKRRNCRPLRSANRWPPKGSRKLRWKR